MFSGSKFSSQSVFHSIKDGEQLAEWHKVRTEQVHYISFELDRKKQPSIGVLQKFSELQLHHIFSKAAGL